MNDALVLAIRNSQVKIHYRFDSSENPIKIAHIQGAHRSRAIKTKVNRLKVESQPTINIAHTYEQAFLTIA